MRDTQGQANAPGTGTEEVVKKTDNPADAAPDDPNAPVLSLSFDKSNEPDKGDQPIVNENVTRGGSTEGARRRYIV